MNVLNALTKVAAGMGAAYAVGQGVSSAYRTLKKGRNVLTTVHDVSPTQAVAGNIVTARCYVEKSVLHIPIMPKLYRAEHVWYCGLLTMLLENRAAQRRGLLLEDSIGAAQTNFSHGLASYQDTIENLEHLGDKYFDMELFREYKQPLDERMEEIPDKTVKYREKLNQISHPSSLDPLNQDHTAIVNNVKADNSINDIGKNALLPVGQIIRVTTTEPNPGGGSPIQQSVSILVRIDPYEVSPKAMEDILNFGADLPEYIKQVKRNTNEVKFWNDYVHSTKDSVNTADLLSPEKQEFREFLKDLRKKQADFKKNRADSIFMMSIGSLSSNLANTILIVSEETIKKVKKDLGYDFLREETRSKFFAKTYCMMVIVIDTYYNKVTVYMNGIPVVGTYSFKDFEKGDKTIDADTFLQLFSQAGQQSISAARRF